MVGAALTLGLAHCGDGGPENASSHGTDAGAASPPDAAGQRYGSGSFHHNIVIGTGDLFVEFFPTDVPGDPHGPGDEVSFEDNYFSDTSSSGVYTHAAALGMSLRFERNLLRGFRFNYAEVYPDASPSTQVFSIGSGTQLPHMLRQNIVDGAYPFAAANLPAIATATQNQNSEIEAIRFRDFMNPALEADVRTLEWWTAQATLAPGAEKPAVSYRAGSLMMHGGSLYEALSDNTGLVPDEHPATSRSTTSSEAGCRSLS